MPSHATPSLLLLNYYISRTVPNNMNSHYSRPTHHMQQYYCYFRSILFLLCLAQYKVNLLYIITFNKIEPDSTGIVGDGYLLSSKLIPNLFLNMYLYLHCCCCSTKNTFIIESWFWLPHSYYICMPLVDLILAIQTLTCPNS